MEEDLKRIENLIESLNEIPLPYDVYINENDKKSLENLIKGYRELEEENNKFRNGEIVTGKLMAVTKKHLFNDLKDYIPKSKVKEKIEKLKKEFDFYAGREHAEWQDGEFDGEVCDDIALKIQVLRELMED